LWTRLRVADSSSLNSAESAGMTSRLKMALPTIAPTPRENSSWTTVLRTTELSSGKLEPTATTIAPWKANGSP
jgi:hypothetical protein